MTKSHPRVSVIIPAYNAGWCIGRLLDSIATQSFTDFEVVVVNDGSKDDTAAVAQAFVDRDARFRLISQPNGGVAMARNRALAETHGEYLAPVDADDLWHPDYLKEMVDALDAPGAAQAPFAFCYSRWMDEHDLCPPTPEPFAPPRSDFIGLLRRNAVGNGSCAVFRRARVLEVGGYDGSLKTRGAAGGEDWKLVLEMAAIGPGVVVDKYLVGYRRSDNSLSANSMLQAKSSLIVLEDMRRRFPKAARRHFWAARTDFLVWLLPQWARAGNKGAVLKYGALAYLANPLWFTSPQARHLLSRTVRGLLGVRKTTGGGPTMKFGDHALS